MENGIKKNNETVEALVRQTELALKNHDCPRPFTVAFSNWINGFEYYKVTKENAKRCGVYTFKLTRTIKLTIIGKDGTRVLVSMEESVCGNSIEDAEEILYERFIRRILRNNLVPSAYKRLILYRQLQAHTQMDFAPAGEIAGEAIADRESNVILEAAECADEEKITDVSSAEKNRQLASTEQPYDLIGSGYSLMNRWYPLQLVTIKEDTTDIFSLRIPEALYKDKSTVNLLPLKGFIYGKLDIEFKLVLNAAPFHCGRIVMGVFYCPQGYNQKFQSLLGITAPDGKTYEHTETTLTTEILSKYGMVQRPHCFIDLAESTTGSILMTYNYNKPFVRLLDYAYNKDVNPGVLGGYFANLKATMLTPLRTADETPKYVDATLYYRFVEAKLTGMTRQHELMATTQMDVVSTVLSGLSLVNEVVGAGGEIINSVERQLSRKGKRTTNRDKPSMQFSSSVVIPRARNHFPNGVGLADPIVMAMDVKSLSTQYEEPGYGPQNYLDFARIPGISDIVQWKLNQAAKTVIYSSFVQPYPDFKNVAFGEGGVTNLRGVDPIPIHIAANGYMYWAGTIVYEFDFVKTKFHKGSVMISISYGKDTNDDIGSNYEKIVDVQSTTKIKVTVPYIYDTTSRRSDNCSYLSAWPQPGNWHPDALPTYNRTKISLIVMNPLIQIEGVSNEIDVIVWKYAGPDFYLGSICQVNNLVSFTPKSSDPIRSLQGFPRTPYIKDLSVATEYGANYPHTQMDYEDFRAGVVDQERCHTGDEVSFKNILRMPIRIIFNEEVKAAKCMLLPVVPLTIELQRYYLSGRMAMTHQNQILRMFRMWRGGLRYTILVSTQKPVYVTYLPPDGTWKEKSRPKNLNDRYLYVNGAQPPAQPTIIDVPTFFTGVSDLSGSGNYTTVIVPTLNPTEQIEIPWNLPVNWAFMNQDNLRVQGTYRDISNTNNGHLAIYSDEDFKVSVFLSVADDFEMGAFCGLTDNINVSRSIWRDDARYKTQMDFNFPEINSNDDFLQAETQMMSINGDLLQEVADYNPNLLSLLERAKPYLKPICFAGSHLLPEPMASLVKGIIIAHTVTDTTAKIDKTATSLAKVGEVFKTMEEEHLVNKVASVVQTVQDTSSTIMNTANDIRCGTLLKIDKVLDGCHDIAQNTKQILGMVQHEGILDGFSDWVYSSFAQLGEGTFERIKKIFSDIYQSLISSDMESLIKWIAHSFVELGYFTYDYLTSKLGIITNSLCNIFGTTIGKTQSLGAQNELDSACFDTNDYQTLVGVIMSGIVATMGHVGFKSDNADLRSKEKTWANLLMGFRFVTGTNACISLVKSLYGVCEKILGTIIGYDNEEVRIRTMLKDSQSQLGKFVENAQLFLNDFNDEAIADVATKAKFWLTICNAHQITAALTRIKGDSATNTLKNICRDVIKKANDNMSLFKATSVRYEPYVSCLEGDPGIGKSFLISRLATTLLRNLDLKLDNIDFIYNVTAGCDYWNLYHPRHLIIVYDDWCNLVDVQSIRRQVSELYQLKTCNVMNAPKAELNEKKTVVNPLGVIMATNNPFPKTNALVDMKPLYRRRDMLVRVQLKPNVDLKTPGCYDNFKHLLFGIYDSVLEKQSTFVWMEFDEFEEEYKRRHTEYHIKESANVKKRMSILNEVLTEQALVCNDIADPFTLQARCLYETERLAEERGAVSALPSEMLQHQVEDLIRVIQDRFEIFERKDEAIVLRDKFAGSHTCPLPNTQLLGETVSYFTTPIVDTWNALKTYLYKWLELGYNCTRCASNTLHSGVCMKCHECGTYLCGFCVKKSEEGIKCACGGIMEIHAPEFLDLIISHIVSAVTETIAPISGRAKFVISLFNFFCNSGVAAPAVILAFLTNYVTRLNTVTYYPGKTQMDAELDLPIPASYCIGETSTKGDCLLNAIWKAMHDKKKKVPTYREFVEVVSKESPPDAQGWYSTDIHGKLIAMRMGVHIHVIEQCNNAESGWLHTFITSKGEVKCDPNWPDEKYEHPDVIHIINRGNNHFEAVVKQATLKLPCLKKVHFAPEHYELVTPKDWWYDQQILKVGEEHECLHSWCKEALDLDVRFEIVDSSFKYESNGKIYSAPMHKCCLGCELDVKLLKLLVEAYYTRNRLAMKEHLGMVKKGMTALDEKTVPNIFRSRWLESSMKQTVEEVTSTNSWFGSIIGPIVKLGTTGAIVYVISKMVKYCGQILWGTISWTFRLFFGDVQYFLDSPTSRKADSVRQRVRTVAGKTQAEVESKFTRDIRDKICSNYVVFKTASVKRMIGLGVFNSRVLIPKHYIRPLQDSEEVEISFFSAKHETFKMNPRNLKVHYFKDRDCALIDLGKAIYFCDITKFFMSEEELKRWNAMRGTIAVPQATGEVLEFNTTISGIHDEYNAYDDYTRQVFLSKGAIDYNFEQRGACGSVLFTEGRKPIVGIHVAGHTGLRRGVGVRVSVEDLRISSDILSFGDLPYELEEAGMMDFGEDVNVEYLGRVRPDMTPFMPVNTNIEHSLIDKHFKTANKTEPAILTAKDSRYKLVEANAGPLIMGVKKHGKPTLDFDDVLVNLSAKFWVEKLTSFKWSFPHKVQIYTAKQATLGLSDCADFYDWLPDSTSAGWPYNVMQKPGEPLRTQKKHWMFYKRDEQGMPVDVEFDPLVIENLERDMEFRRKGILAPIVFQDMLKDEKRPIEKLMKAGGTRVFSMSPIHASIALRQYTLDLTSYMRSNRIDNWIGIGINPDGPEWGKVASRLRRFGNNMFSIDFSNFGPGLNIGVAGRFAQLLQTFLKKFNPDTTEDDLRVSQCLINELMYSTHLAGGTLYRTKAGSPSGAAITVEINSFTHLMYISLCWLIIGRILDYARKNELSADEKSFVKQYNKVATYISDYVEEHHFEMFDNLHEFMHNVTGVVYGDDGLFSVTDKYKDIFNAKVIQLILATHGIVATDASKSSSVVAYSDLSKITFLKRSFVPHPKYRAEYLAPIDTTSIEECARWIRKGQPAELMTIDNAAASLLLAYGHGADYFEKWRKTLNEYLEAEDLETNYLTWDNIDVMFYPAYYGGNMKVNKDISQAIKNLQAYTLFCKGDATAVSTM